MTRISIRHGIKRTHCSANCRANARARPNVNRLDAVSNVSIFGSGYAYARIYGRFRPKKSRTYNITAKYFRHGFRFYRSVAKIFFYIRPDGAGPIRKEAENMVADTNGTVTKAKRFSLRKGKGYNVGVELYTRAKAFGDPASVANYFDGNNGVQVKYLTVT